jgi:hypothetical protein
MLLKKENQSNDEATFEEGINADGELKRDAAKEESDKGDYSEVTTLSLDETIQVKQKHRKYLTVFIMAFKS